ncbi:MAG TPA: cytochrome P450 [Mycobacteriales bacterium]|nr:cytochrome P450 [Mycobacteriales bacterium]
MTTTAACPVHEDIDLLDPAFLTDPFPLSSRLREESPVFYVPEIDLHFVTRYDDIQRIFLDRDTFAAAIASSPVWPPCAAAAKIMSEGISRVPTLTNADPPRHAPMREAVHKCLTPQRIKSLEPALRAQARKLIEGFAQDERVELSAQLAFPFPGYVGFMLLGFPERDWEMLKTWCRNRVLITYGHLTEQEQVDVAKNMVAFWDYCTQIVADHVRNPRDNFTTDLLAWAEDPEHGVTRNDVESIVYSIALAGHDSTTNLFTNGLRFLLANRDQWDAVRQDRTLLPNAVEEMLRFDPPIAGWRRITTRDTEVGGTFLPAGSKLFLSFVSAHRDDAQFPDADTFDIERPNARTHLSFGKGVHMCLGAPLARMEMRVAVELLGELTPHMTLVEDQSFEQSPNLVFRTMRELWAYTGNVPAAS